MARSKLMKGKIVAVNSEDALRFARDKLRNTGKVVDKVKYVKKLSPGKKMRLYKVYYKPRKSGRQSKPLTGLRGLFSHDY